MTTSTENTFVNYYEILGMSPAADATTLERKIKEELRTWRKREASPDRHKRREAEVRVQHLSIAREVLLDPAKRKAFDRALATQPVPEAVPQDSGGTGDWLALTEGYLARNEYQPAAHTAREATLAQADLAVAWNLRARADGGLGNLADAAYEARQAAELDPASAPYQFDLGSILEQAGRWRDARAAYQAAARLDPSAFLYPLAIAGIYLQLGAPDQALPLIEKIHQARPDEEIVNFYLANCLHDLAECVPSARQGEQYWITSEEEIHAMEALIARAESLPHNDSTITAALSKLSGYVLEGKKAKFSPILGFRALAVLSFVAFCLVFGGFGAMGSGSPSGGALSLLSGLALGFLLVRTSWRPAWKINKSLHHTG